MEEELARLRARVIEVEEEKHQLAIKNQQLGDENQQLVEENLILVMNIVAARTTA